MASHVQSKEGIYVGADLYINMYVHVQVDPEVLKELPAEIRQQIEREMIKQRRSRTKKPVDMHGEEEQRRDNSEVPAVGESNHPGDVILALPSPSQVFCLLLLLLLFFFGF